MSGLWDIVNAGVLSEWIGGTLIKGEPETVFTGLSTDSREIKRGQLFWALRGYRFDGHDFVESALDRGAAGAVIQSSYWEDGHRGQSLAGRLPLEGVLIGTGDTLTALGTLAAEWRAQNKTRLAAITGSSGKTTTKELTANILARSGKVLKNQGNFNNLIGLPLTLLMLDSSHESAVLEMGMNRSGEIARLTEIADPDLGLITNVGMAHLEGVGDLDGVARAKTELIERLSPRAAMIINGDDRRLSKAAASFDRKMTTFGTKQGCDVRADKIQNFGREGVAFEIQYPGGHFPVRLRVPGLQNVLNAAAASAIGLSFNVPISDISAALEHFQGIKGRFELVTLPNGTLLIDDTYNANPSSLKTALESVKGFAEKGVRLIIALGEMMELGEAAERSHFEAGRLVGLLRPYCFLAMGDHGRTMAEGAADQGMSRKDIFVTDRHQQMIEIISEKVKENDLILIKGSRSMGLEKVVQGLRNRMGTGRKNGNIRVSS